MIIFISHNGESLPIAYRMLQEGTDCGVYVHDPVHARRCYEGILERVRLTQLRRAVEIADTIIIDGARTNQGTPQDLALLQMFGCRKDSRDLFADLGDALRDAGKSVIGAGAIIPVFEPAERDNIRVEGWFNGQEWTFFTCCREDTRLMNADNGPDVGCQQCTTWTVDEAESLAIHTPALRESGYKGPVSLKDGILRLGFSYDSLYGTLSMISGSLEAFFNFEEVPEEKFSACERLSIPPYPYAGREMLDELARDTLITGKIEDHPSIWFQDIYHDGHGLSCAGSDGVIGIAAHAGKIAAAAWSKVYKAIERLGVQGNMQIRTDGARRALKAAGKGERRGR
jgi:hypothetical protein